MSQEKRLIAVVGATGQQGASVVAALMASGAFRVRALTRDPEHYQGPAGEASYANLDSPDTMASAFRQPKQTGDGAYLPLVGDRMSFDRILGSLKEQGQSLTFTWVPAKDFEGLFRGARELAQMMAWFEAYGYLGGDYSRQIELAQTVAGTRPRELATWARASMPVDQKEVAATD